MIWTRELSTPSVSLLITPSWKKSNSSTTFTQKRVFKTRGLAEAEKEEKHKTLSTVTFIVCCLEKKKETSVRERYSAQ